MGIDMKCEFVEFGDHTPLDSTAASHCATIEPLIAEIHRRGLKPLTLGGDHSLTFSLVKALRLQLGKPFIIVHFDAHPDIYNNFQDNPNSHASPFARILEYGRSPQEAAARLDGEEQICSRLISVGLRTITQHQREQLNRFQVHLVEAKDFPAKGSDLATFLRPLVGPRDAVYLSFDLDVLEPVR
jgi:arginase family enzyme